MSKPSGTVIDLFSHPASDKSLSTRIDCIVAAVVMSNRLYVELGLSGPEPPRDWLRGLICVVRNSITGIERSIGIERVTHRDGDHFMVRSFPLPPNTADGFLPFASTITIRSANGIVCSRTCNSMPHKPSA